MTRVVIGSRGSELALTQSNYIAARLRAVEPGLEVEVKIISTRGDRITDVPLSQVGGKGIFTKELEVSLLAGEIDLAVHSLKDLPTELPEGLCVGAIPEREHPADALISANGAGLMALPEGARVGTSSTRRQVQLRAVRPDLDLVDLRGNVPTRLKKIETDGLDAIILAAAGLNRLGLAEHITETLAPEVMLSAVGQGALGIEIRQNDARMTALLAKIHHPETAAAATAERTLLAALGGGCQVPLGALAEVAGDTLRLRACACSPDGTQVVRAEKSGPANAPEALGRAVAAALIEGGASAFIRQVALDALKAKQPLAGRAIVVTRSEEQGGALAAELAALGASVVEFPVIAIRPATPEHPLPAPAEVDWLILTSVNGVNHFARALDATGRAIADYRAVDICAIGPATAAALRAHGMPVSLTPKRYIAESIVEAFARLEGGIAGKRFLLPRGNLARPELPDALRAAGAEAVEAVVYDTVPADPGADAVTAMLAARPDLVVFTSSSTARNFAGILGEARLTDLKAHAAFASIGPITTETAEKLGMAVGIEPEVHDIPALVHAIIQGTDTPLDPVG